MRRRRRRRRRRRWLAASTTYQRPSSESRVLVACCVCRMSDRGPICHSHAGMVLGEARAFRVTCIGMHGERDRRGVLTGGLIPIERIRILFVPMLIAFAHFRHPEPLNKIKIPLTTHKSEIPRGTEESQTGCWLARVLRAGVFIFERRLAAVQH